MSGDERWRQVRGLFDAVCDLPPEQWRARLERLTGDPELLRETLQKVSLGHLQGRLDEEQDWAKILSPGEQQRVAFARILLLKPKLVFLDEATSAVDEGLEYALYALIREEVPDTMLVSVAHRSGNVGRELQAARLLVPLDVLLEPRLVDRQHVALQAFDFLRVHIGAEDFVAGLGQAGTDDETDVTRTNDGNLHAG